MKFLLATILFFTASSVNSYAETKFKWKLNSKNSEQHISLQKPAKTIVICYKIGAHSHIVYGVKGDTKGRLLRGSCFTSSANNLTISLPGLKNNLKYASGHFYLID